jgi:hypothetical protein
MKQELGARPVLATADRPRARARQDGVATDRTYRTYGIERCANPRMHPADDHSSPTLLHPASHMRGIALTCRAPGRSGVASTRAPFHFLHSIS